MNNSCIIWYNPKKRVYYHKLYHGLVTSYNIGDANSYGHYIVYKFRLYNEHSVKINLKQKILRALINELEKGDL